MSTEERRKYSNILGEIAEQFCFLEALKRGAEVYPNYIKVGRTDVIMKIYGKLYEFDVKTGWWDEGCQLWAPKRVGAIKPPQWPVLVEIEPLKCRWVGNKGRPYKDPIERRNNQRCPEGLEDFWN